MTDASHSLVLRLAPASDATTVETLVDWPASFDEPFSDRRRATLAQLSSRILRDPRLRADAASVALAYWLRRSNIDRLAAAFAAREALDAEVVYVPTGRVFHVAPGNVDTVFVYSWALSFLCGNQNIVRVSGQQSEVLSALLVVLSTLMMDDPSLSEGNRFITYGHDDEITGALSLWSDHRVVWGGDDTVTRIRALPLSAHASERAFASKYSWSVVDAAVYAAASEATHATLAGGYFNDIFWFDQMACSSPHMIVWVGSAEVVGDAIERFDNALAGEITRRGYQGPPGAATHRLNYVFDLAVDANVRADLAQREFLGVRLVDGEPWRKEQCGAGLFVHARADSLAEVGGAAARDSQTVTHYGFTGDTLRRLARDMGARGVDRLVPVGEALAFEPTWDGYDLIGDFLRRVSVREGQT